MKYEYNHEFSTRLESYNEEQQAEIIGHYMQKRRAVIDFMAFSKDRKNQDVDIAFKDRKLTEYCAELIPFEVKLTPVLPIQPLIGCPRHKL